MSFFVANKTETWRLYQTAKATASRPSVLVRLDDPWTAYQFDSTVTFVGTVIENAVQETVKTGSEDKPEWKPKYTLNQLLDPDFRLSVDGEGQTRKDSEFEDFVSFIEGGRIQGMKYEKVG